MASLVAKESTYQVGDSGLIIIRIYHNLLLLIQYVSGVISLYIVWYIIPRVDDFHTMEVISKGD